MTVHDDVCLRCGGDLDPQHLGYDYVLPDPIAGFTHDDLVPLIQIRTDAVLTIADYGSFIRVLMPVALDDGRHVTFGVWLRILTAEDFDRIGGAWRGDGYASLTFQGQLTNGVQPWGDDLLGVRAHAAVLDPGRIPFLVGSDSPALTRVLRERWPADYVLSHRPGAPT